MQQNDILLLQGAQEMDPIEFHLIEVLLRNVTFLINVQLFEPSSYSYSSTVASGTGFCSLHFSSQ